MRYQFTQAHLVLPDRVVPCGTLVIEDGQIVALPTQPVPELETRVLASEEYLLPGLIDLHSDAIEGQMEPRAGVRFPLDLAVNESDRLNTASGITTAFHGITFDEAEFGRRGPDAAAEIVAALNTARPGLLIDHRIHCRYEQTAPSGHSLVRDLIESGQVHLLSFMDHSPGVGNMAMVEVYQGYVFKRSGKLLKTDEIESIIERKNQDRQTARDRIRELSQLVQKRGVPLACHDPESPAEIEDAGSLGCTLCEFPLNVPTAEAAKQAGLHTILGSPNLLRGGSHVGALSALEAIRHGVADCICSDYAPASLLPAVWRVPELTDLPLCAALNFVTLHPARALGLNDRGALALGKRADLLRVQVRDGRPRVLETIVAGKSVYRIDYPEVP